MSFIEEESKRERELRQAVEKAAETDKDIPKSLKSKETRRSESAKEKSERARKDYEQKQKTLEYKRERLEWQKSRSKIKDKLRQEAEKKRREKEAAGAPTKMQQISSKDKDPTAYQKMIGNIASFGKGVAKAALSSGTDKDKAEEQPKKPSDKNAKDAFKKRMRAKMNQKLLPGSSVKGNLPSPKPPAGLLPSSGGQRARQDPTFKKREIEKRGGTVTEEFSCWREEFLYELGDMRRKKKKDKDGEERIVDVMKGKNKVTVGPIIKESYIEERKRDQLTNALLGLSFATNLAQSPEALIRSGHIEGPSVQLMSRMMQKRKEANRNLDSARVSEPARNKKKNNVKEDLDKKNLLIAIVKKLIDEKKRKNYLINSGYIGEESNKDNMKCNKPKAEPVGDSLTGKSHVVKACEGGKEQLIRFGQRGVKGSPKKEGESEAYANRRKRFKARHAKNISKGKMSAAYWADKIKW